MTARKKPISGLCAFSTLLVTLLLEACGTSIHSGGPAAPATPIVPTPIPAPSVAGQWTWISGSAKSNEPGMYGSQGVASNTNVPGARGYSTGWTDNSGNLWLFGGWGFDGATTDFGPFNDLWEFAPTAGTWTWVNGDNFGNTYGQRFAPGVYGTKGVASASNVPIARYGAVSWKDRSGNLWLFGGSGYVSKIDLGSFNDLWEFNLTNKQWTWVSGSNSTNARGNYGTQGIAAVDNVPGARGTAQGDEGTPVSWTDKSGNFWLFGGRGYDASGAYGELNDLWEFNLTTGMWTWISGSSYVNGGPIYGTQGTAAAANTPGARDDAIAWTDNDGNFWLYGGHGRDFTGTISPDLSDLWKFDPATKQWSWVSGSLTTPVTPNYGTRGVAAASNTPGGRYSAVGWVDSNGNLWLFGGFAYGPDLYFDDLWKFSPASNEWTWVSGGSADGAHSANETGVYGTPGVAASGGMPGERGVNGAPVAWTDSSGNFWLFGGFGEGAPSSALGELNDLWCYHP